MMNDYWADYLMHSEHGSSRNDWNDYLMHRKHKYIKKIGSGRNARYFYTMDELRAYYKLQTAPADTAYAARTKKNKLVDTAQDKVDYKKDEKHGLYTERYKDDNGVSHVRTTNFGGEEYEKNVYEPREREKARSRRKRDRESKRRVRRAHRRALVNTAKKAIRGRSRAERIFIP